MGFPHWLALKFSSDFAFPHCWLYGLHVLQLLPFGLSTDSQQKNIKEAGFKGVSLLRGVKLFDQIFATPLAIKIKASLPVQRNCSTMDLGEVDWHGRWCPSAQKRHNKFLHVFYLLAAFLSCCLSNGLYRSILGASSTWLDPAPLQQCW